jgi:hypothetical protein
MVEPEAKFVENGHELVGTTLVKCGETVPIRLMNITDETKQICKGTMVAKMTAADEADALDKERKHDVGL